MSEFPESPWHNDRILVGGLAMVNEALAVFLENVIDVKRGEAEPVSAKVVASLGCSMVEVGNALQGRITNSLSDDLPAPPFPAPS